MANRHVLFNLSLLGIFSIGAVSWISAGAQASEDLSQLKESSARVSFVPPLDSPAPRRTQSGASRLPLPGVCDGLPLLPEGGVGLTTGNSSSLFVYFAEGTTVETAMLTLKSLDEDESEYYETLVTIPREELSTSGGVVEFEMPQAADKLAMDEEYQWSLALRCKGNVRPDSPFLMGYLKRIDAGLNLQVDSPSLLEQASAYGKAGVWYELLDTLAVLRAENPDDVVFSEYWADILKTAGLDEIASAPLIVQE